MKRIQLVSTIAALLLAGPALAGNGHGHGNSHKNKGHSDHDRVVRVDDRGHDWKAEGRHDNGLHLGQHKQWARGQRLPGMYLEQQYYIRDYRDYGLVAPPQGMVWVRPYQDDRTFYLVQAASGLISQILGR
jgi:Ni/Co efflux regulator RcnB